MNSRLNPGTRAPTPIGGAAAAAIQSPLDLMSLPPSLSQCGDPLAPFRPSVRLLVRSLVRSAIVSSVLSTAPIPEAKREGEREGIGGRHRRPPRPGILISKFGSGAKSQSRQFFPGSQRRKDGRDDAGGRRARGSVQDCVVGRPTYEKGQSCGRGAGLGIYVMKLHMGKNTMVLTNDLEHALVKTTSCQRLSSVRIVYLALLCN